MQHLKGYRDGVEHDHRNPKPGHRRSDVGKEKYEVDEVIAGWLGPKFAAIDRNVQKPEKEYGDTESVRQEVDEHWEIILTVPDESSLAYPLSGQLLRMMVEWTPIHTEQKDGIEGRHDTQHD
jgi:hypothetical protein